MGAYSIPFLFTAQGLLSGHNQDVHSVAVDSRAQMASDPSVKRGARRPRGADASRRAVEAPDRWVPRLRETCGGQTSPMRKPQQEREGTRETVARSWAAEAGSPQSTGPGGARIACLRATHRQAGLVRDERRTATCAPHPTCRLTNSADHQTTLRSDPGLTAPISFSHEYRYHTRRRAGYARSHTAFSFISKHPRAQ